MKHRAALFDITPEEEGDCFNRATIVWLYYYIIRWKEWGRKNLMEEIEEKICLKA